MIYLISIVLLLTDEILKGLLIVSDLSELLESSDVIVYGTLGWRLNNVSAGVTIV